ncbi:CCA tRNA nucleotidyltransferase, mitochondrial [Rhizophlyctis rosea]|nr:CCA tRNA nucleotidyltransferase, mitochondrial [Rhizophlyctis rosea]
MPTTATSSALHSSPLLRLEVGSESGMPPKITLTDSETKLFDLLVGATKYIKDTQPDAAPVTLRVAGGWVRDKLLGLDSHDIDIAIDTMTGEPFASALKKYMLHLVETKGPGHEDSDLAMGSIATIQVNPEKSKHLETATAKVMGLMIDFVHLRTETYGADSRNPVVGFGTPLEDALRRDITINALFYNLNTRVIEDCTGKGIPDLRNGLIRTPLPPLQTFIDDPLRILRVIRFATRFNYKLNPDILAAVQNPDIKDSFERKITRNRVGVEVDKMMAKSAGGVEAMEYIEQFGFWEEVFGVKGLEIPPKVTILPNGTEKEGLGQKGVDLDNLDSQKAILCGKVIRSILSSQHLTTLFPNTELLPLTGEAQRFMYFACALSPLEGAMYRNKAQIYPLARFVILDGLRLSNKDADTVAGLIQAADSIRNMVHKLKSRGWQCERKELGLYIRKIAGSIHELWTIGLLIALAEDVLGRIRDDARLGNGAWLEDPGTQELVDDYAKFMKLVTDYDLQKAYDYRPLLTGKRVSEIFNEKAGPRIGQHLQRVMEWQLTNPQGTKEECEQYMVATFGEGK